MYGSAATLESLKNDLFNDRVWPDVERLSKAESPLVRFATIEESKPLEIAGLTITPVSLDHVVPRSQGGGTSWENLVCCCLKCNVRKGGRTPEQAGMHLISRPVKPGPESHGYSVDAVVMDSIVGPKHTHTNGEIDLCFAQEGDPRFDGHPAGWVVFGPGTTHRPTVRDGRMLILYFLPGGAIEFHRD